ncbi:MAG: LysR family transcriptional regulator [Pseudomonadota bacterium]
MDRFEDLRAFVQVVESGSLTKAASALKVATSAVSRRIKELEERLGTQLLQRTTRQMRLTASGETFHARATQILQSLEEAEAEAGDNARTLSGTLRLAAPLSFGRSHLGPILVDFAREHPELKLDIDFSDRHVDLIAEGHDLAFRIGNLADSTLVARRITEIKTVICAAPAFWEIHGLPDTPDDLTGLPALCYVGSERVHNWRYVAPDGATDGVLMRPAMHANNGNFLCDAAIAGLGVILQPSFTVHDAIERGDLQAALCDYSWPTVTAYAVYPQTRHLSARARAFIDFTRQRLGPKPDWEGFLDAALAEGRKHS